MSPQGWEDLVKFLKKQAFSLKTAERLGLIKKSKKNDYYNVFRSRLMFPIQSYSGNYIGFGGRELDGSTPKYMNSSESEVVQ